MFGEMEGLKFNWDTSGAQVGNYKLKVEFEVPYIKALPVAKKFTVE